jgi:hypothetical protein
MESDLDIVVTPHHRARVCVKRILRADEIATALRDVLACMNCEREPVVIADWGDMFVESSRPIDGNIDVFPLGVMCYRMLTGSEPPPQLLFVPGAPPQLARLIVRMLSANPGQRPNILDVKAVIASMLGTHDDVAPLVLPPDDVEDLLDLAPPPAAPPARVVPPVIAPTRATPVPRAALPPLGAAPASNKVPDLPKVPPPPRGIARVAPPQPKPAADDELLDLGLPSDDDLLTLE